MKLAGGSGTAFRYWALCALFSLVVASNEECEWTERNEEGDTAGATLGPQDIETLEDCRNWCLENRDTCVGVQYQPASDERCFKFHEEPTLSAGGITGYTYHNYSCPADPTTTTEPPTSTAAAATSATSDSCTMQEESNKEVTSSTPFSDTITADSEFCKTVCKWTSECTAITYEESTSTCTIHTSPVTEGGAAGNTFSRKTDCDGGNACCFEDDSLDTQGTSTSNYLLNLRDELQSCKTACEEVSLCTALTLSDGDRCSLYTAASFERKDQSGSSYYSKSCTGGSLTFASICYSHGIQLQFSKLLGILLVAVYTALL